MDGVKDYKVKKGYAYGIQQIRNDSIFFRSGTRTWEFPAIEVLSGKHIAHYNGITYLAKIKDLEALEKKNGLRRT